ncbi:hypothetical protein GCM10010300_67490 [Streptomyces olivaceoviridis]|nr:hypothetical protein GCM10010300_67490 [Streptomyces olivaceoviridis]
MHAPWPALRQARPARAVSPELVALHDRRADSANAQQHGAEEEFGHGTESRVWRLRRSGKGGMFDTCAGSFDAVWETVTPVREG